jgi:hypothetical protein
MMFEQKM